MARILHLFGSVGLECRGEASPIDVYLGNARWDPPGEVIPWGKLTGSGSFFSKSVLILQNK